jgi:hypothetical protein
LTGKTINKQTSKKELIIKEEKIVNNETTRTSPTLAEAIYKIDEKNENGASEYVMSDYHPKIESLIVLNDVIPDKTYVPAKQDTPVGISSNNDIPDKPFVSAKQSTPAGISTNNEIPDRTVFAAKQDTPAGISTNNEIPDKPFVSAKQGTPTGISSNNDIPDKTSVPVKQGTPAGISTNNEIPDKPFVSVKQDTPAGISTNNEIPDKPFVSAKQDIPAGISINNEISTSQSSARDISEWTSVLGTTSSAKQDTPANKPVNSQFNKNTFIHKGKQVKPIEILQLVNDRFVFGVGKYTGTEYLELDAMQIMINLYNQLLNQDIVKYHQLPFRDFERIMIISKLDLLQKEGKEIPRDQQELQSYVVMLNSDHFEEVFDYFTNNKDYYRTRIVDLEAKYSRYYDHPS